MYQATRAPQTTASDPLPLVSASQITLWTECQRKWGFKYLEKIEVPPHPGALLGTEVHQDQLGPYLTAGRGFNVVRPSGEIANALAPLLPRPMTPGLRVERKFVIPSPSGKFEYLGYIDLYAPDSGVVPGLAAGAASGLPLVGDFKTTSNLKYAKTEEVLGTDFQAQIYAMAVMFEERVDRLDLVWFTVRTRKPHRAQRAHLRVDGAHVVEQFERIDAIGQELVAIKLSKPSVQDLPPNARMCDAYGGCPYRNRCNLSPAVYAEAMSKELSMTTNTTNDFLARLRKNVSPEPAIIEVAQTVPELPTEVVETVAINPPESALPPAAPIGVAAPVEEKNKRGRPAKAKLSEDQVVVAAAETYSSFPLPALKELVSDMKALGIKRIKTDDIEIELEAK